MKVLGWYVVNNIGDALFLDDRECSRIYAERWNTTCPKTAPHRAVLLAEIDESEVTNNGTIISETLKHEAGRSIDIAKNNERFLKGRRK